MRWISTPSRRARANEGRPASSWMERKVPFSASSSCRVRPGLRSSGSRKARLKSTRVNSSSISRPEKPQAMSAPMSAPALVPVMLSTGTPSLLQALDHADVGHGPGAAAAQHQGHAWAARAAPPGGRSGTR